MEVPLIGYDSGDAWAPLIDTADDDMNVGSKEV